jgi:hypothetical protein
MSSFQVLEVFTISIIIIVQVYNFFSTARKIYAFKSAFPNADAFNVVKVKLKPDFVKLHPKEILAKLTNFIKESNLKIVSQEVKNEEGDIIRPAKYEEDVRIDLDLIDCRDVNTIIDNICYSLNTYLIKNKGVAADFHLIKDVVERNTDAREEEIDQSISLPLYLGLLGTFVGIVMGLFQISGVNFSENSNALDDAISTLLNGVMIAMVASFMGLLLMIINSHRFKSAKSFVEDNKNGFYTFIQTELLPLLNQNINSTLYSLQNNLHKFNEEFKTNISGLSSVMGKNHDALVAQEKILTTLDEMDITEFAKANVIILKELTLSTEKFAEFNHYLSLMNGFVNSTNGLTTKVNVMIERTENFNTLGKNIITTFEENKKLVEFLQSHYDALDQSHQLITNSVSVVNTTLENSLTQLKDFTQEKINEIQKITLSELALMQSEYPEKWKKLDNLTYLESLNKNLNDLKMSTAGQIGSMSSEIKSISCSLNLVNNSLVTLNENTRKKPFSPSKSFFEWIKNKS